MKIQFLDTLEAIRRRPGMYVGETNATGMHHLLFWTVDDVVANARAGRGSAVLVGLGENGSCYVADEGPWSSNETPRLIDSVDQRSSELLEGVQRGMAPETQIRSYLPIVRALSTRMTVWVRRDDNMQSVTYAGVSGSGEWEADAEAGLDRRWQCVVRFWPDAEIFSDVTWDHAKVRLRLEEATASCPGLRAYLLLPGDESEMEEVTVPDGMAGVVARFLARAGEDGHQPSHPFRLRVDQGDLAFDVAIQWHWGDEVKEMQTVQSWANTVKTTDGSHVLAVRDALRAAGLHEVPHVAAVSVFVPHPRFTSPTKGTLRSPEIRTMIRDHLTPALRRLAEHDEFALQLFYMKTRRAELAAGGDL